MVLYLYPYCYRFISKKIICGLPKLVPLILVRGHCWLDPIELFHLRNQTLSNYQRFYLVFNIARRYYRRRYFMNAAPQFSLGRLHL